MSDHAARILVVDDVPENVRLLETVLEAHGYDIVSATDGRAALELAVSAKPDLVLLDVLMPQPDGYAVCRRLREQEETAVLPVIMLTASEGSEKTKAIEAGADDFIPKPFNREELLTRIRSLLRIKRYHDTIKAQAAELRDLNRTLEERVQTQLEELDRLQRLRRFLSPQLADAIVSSGDESILRSHRRQVAMFFADLRGWTNFVDAVEPEELMRVLGEFHGTIGGLVRRFDATVGFIEGDGVQLFFNDPIEVPDPALRAVRLGCSLREEMAELTALWQKRGYDLDFGAGIALGYATCGEIGFEDRSDYAAIGVVTNLASRLADEATAGQILITQRLYAEVEDDIEVESVGEFALKGFQRPVAAFNVVTVRDKAAAPLSQVSGSSELREGSVLAGYRIESLVARGGMGVVYRATQLSLQREVALKLITPELASQEAFRERFLREARLAASLEHPHVLPVYEVGEADGELFLALRYVEGADLRSLLAGGPLSPERTVRIVTQLCSALETAHARGLLHRDVKPENVLLVGAEGAEHAYLTDFGLAKPQGERALTKAGEVLGSLDYLAPELIDGREGDPRADVYALGCLLYACLTGTPPFARAQDTATLWAHVKEPPPRPSETRPELGAAFDGVVERALAKDPGERFQSAGELAEALSAEVPLRLRGESSAQRPTSHAR